MTRSSRRQFAKALAAAGVALPALAQQAPAVPLPCVPYREQLDDAALTALAKQLQERATQLDALRKFKLQNSDEPYRW